MKGLSDRTLELLLAAGWHPGRSIDIRPYVVTLRTEGYTPFFSVRRFLREFGGLTINFTFSVAGKTLQETLHFCADRAATAVDNEDYVAHFAQRAGTPLCVIGECSGNTTLLMDERGRMFGGCDDTLVLFGHHGTEALDNIITRVTVTRWDK